MHRILCSPMTEFLSTIPSGSVDLVFTDPPWMAGNRSMGDFSYRDDLPILEYCAQYVGPIVRESERILKEGGYLLVWTDYRAACYYEVQIDLHSKMQRHPGQVVESLLGNPGKSFLPCKHSNITVASKGRPEFFDHTKMMIVDRRAPKSGYDNTKPVGSVIPGTLSNTAPERVGYPDQKPLAVCRHFIETLCKPGGIVVDPCMGSGTIPLQAMMSGMVAYGNDFSEKAVALAVSRFNNHNNQGNRT